MNLYDILKWIKLKFVCSNYYSGRADTNKEEYLAIYSLPDSPFTGVSVGASSLLSYDTKVVKFILRFGKDSDSAEKKARELFNIFLPTFDGVPISIGGHRVISFTPSSNEPQMMGTDDRGNFEFTFDVKIIFER